MEKYFPELNEKYRKKNYPDGVFARMHKNTAKVSWAAMWIMNKNKTYLAEGDASFTGMVNVMAGVCGASSSLCAASFYRKSAAAVLQSGRYFHSRPYVRRPGTG